LARQRRAVAASIFADGLASLDPDCLDCLLYLFVLPHLPLMCEHRSGYLRSRATSATSFRGIRPTSIRSSRFEYRMYISSFSLQPPRHCLTAICCAPSGLTVSTIDLFRFSVGRAVHTSLCSPGIGESGARARLASRTIVHCYILVAIGARIPRPESSPPWSLLLLARQRRARPRRPSLARPIPIALDCTPYIECLVFYSSPST
jgi:hypothetical protein